MAAPIKFLCPRWGFEDIPWDTFLKEVKEEGFSGIEWFPFGEPGELGDYLKVLELLQHYELDFAIVMAVIEPYTTFDGYVKKLAADLDQLMQIRTETKAPLFFSAQIGREFFKEDQVIACLALCQQLEDHYQTPIYQETHRNKWSYAAHVVAPILQKEPTLKLTFDVSHWFCVSESYLADQQDAVNAAIKHAKHIHARVGSTQSSQVWDPANVEYTEALSAHVAIWDRWIAKMNSNKEPITITPEFGPAPYLVKGNRTGSLRDEQWRINVWMKDFLKNRYC
jgi:sugar phosphate isomerase/epimerase